MATPPPPYQQQNPYGQQQNPYGQGQNPYGQGQAPYGYVAPGHAPAPAPMMPAALTCRMCGGFPAVQATVRQHQGLLIRMTFMHLKGPFCRNCGLAVEREMTGKTLWQGWWSPMSLVLFTPFTLIWNMTVKSKLQKLPPPTPGQVPNQGSGQQWL
ncbi:hypothetical protein [Streptomyces roseoverticillatus]|uniref:Uncharacterized protein n=1 Tax=Streptomyces roseoverticillatus TaxID=66429 RepID=A0ABV3ISF9_9ACTN